MLLRIILNEFFGESGEIPGKMRYCHRASFCLVWSLKCLLLHVVISKWDVWSLVGLNLHHSLLYFSYLLDSFMLLMCSSWAFGLVPLAWGKSYVRVLKML